MTPATLSAWVLKAALFASTHTGSTVAVPLPPAFADAIAAESIATPLFAGADGDRETAALITSLAWFEGGNDPTAIGDCKIPDPRPGWHPCTEPRIPQSFCALQIHLPGGAKTAEGWTGADLRSDPVKCVRAGLRIVKASILADRSGTCALCVYARGRDTAEARTLSGHRMALAHRIFAEVGP